MKRIIDIPLGTKQVLAQELGVSLSIVGLALSFHRNGEKSQQVRNRALALGGRVYCYLPECETIHDSEGRMVQTFGNGVRMVLDKSSGQVRLEQDGVELASYPNPSVSQLAHIQHYASSI